MTALDDRKAPTYSPWDRARGLGGVLLIAMLLSSLASAGEWRALFIAVGSAFVVTGVAFVVYNRIARDT